MVRHPCMAILTGLCLVSSLPAVACPPAPALCTWDRTFGGELEDKAYGVSPAAEDGLYVTGHSLNQGGVRYKGWTLRLDRAGEELWSRAHGGGNVDQSYGVVPLADGGALIAGHTRSEGAGQSDAWIYRLAADGSVDWTRTVGGPLNDRLRGATRLPDGDLIAVGTSRSLSGFGGYALLALRMAPDGTERWRRVFGGAADDGGFAVAATPDGGAIVAGFSDQGGEASYDLWVLRLDGDGALLWDRVMGGVGFHSGTAVVAAPDGGALVAALSRGADGPASTWVLRLDDTGELLWERGLGGPRGDTPWAATVIPGGVALAISSQSRGPGSADAWIQALDWDGAPLWHCVLGGAQWDRPTALTVTTGGDLVMVGVTTSRGAGYEDVWVARLGPATRPGCAGDP